MYHFLNFSFQFFPSYFGSIFIFPLLFFIDLSGGITASKEGLSYPELEDVLACSEQVLESVYHLI